MSSKLWIGVVAICLVASGVVHASNPTVTGSLQGLELAQQTALNPAVFLGVFNGKVDGRLAFGLWGVAVNHQSPLPDEPGESVLITGGRWTLQVWVLEGFRLRRVDLSGVIAGTLSFHAPDLFAINAAMNLTGGGSGLILLSGILDHTVFPPGVSGLLSQP
jgi:hypothetical protein